MDTTDSDNRHFLSIFSLKNSWKAFGVLLIGLVLTALTVSYTRKYIQKTAIQDFEFASVDLQSKTEARLRVHAQILRSGAALFAVSDTVTREKWNHFYKTSRIQEHFPGIEGYGYTQIIPREELTRHIQLMRESGFPEYNITPEGEREIYTSIIYLEPFSGRNLRAFGYDMFSEPVRRQAMETARDSNFAVLSGRVILVQETNEDIQAGALMYIPVYKNGMPVNTVEERRAAIRGWVYSPYRINDLTMGILGNWDLPGKNRIHLRIYDNDISGKTLLYDSQGDEPSLNKKKPNLSVTLPVRFNDREWTMVSTRNSEDLSLLHGDLLIVLISGISISLLLFFLSLALIRTDLHAREIVKLNKQLQKLNYDKDRFIAVLGHDLRNPFNSMLGFLGILKNDIPALDKDKIRNYIEHINTVAKNTFNLLEDLMEWARAQSGNIPFEPRLYYFIDICMHVQKNLNPNAAAKNIAINCLADRNLRVFADMEMLKSILRNLVTNAIKFTHRGGVINIDAEEAAGQVMISVSDNGIGIKPEDITKLFTITHTLTTKGTDEETGTGLGLILCREFVDMHGGEIRAESKAGKGSRFVFSLPLKGSTETLQAPDPDPELVYS
jgi:signal transduction histidine kinase